MEHSAGILIIYNNKVLLCHPTGASWDCCMPPKGIIEENETPREAASREVFEEIGIKISPSELGYDHFHIEYEKNGKVVKTITIFIYKINSLNEIKLESETVPKEQLQWENDDARFYNIDGVEKYCFWRYKNAIKRYI